MGGRGREGLGVGFGFESVGEGGGVFVAVGGGDQDVDGDLRGAAGEQLALDAGEVVHAGDDQGRAAERGGDVAGLDGLGERVFVEGGAVAEFGGAVAPGAVERGEVGDDAVVVGEGGAVVREAGECFGVDAALAEVGEGDMQGFGEAGGVGVEFAELVGVGEFADDVVEQERGGAGRERGAVGQVGAVGDFAGEVGGGEEVEGGEGADLPREAALVVEALEAGADEDVDAGEALLGARRAEQRLEAVLGGGDIAAALDGEGHRERVARERVCVAGARLGCVSDFRRTRTFSSLRLAPPPPSYPRLPRVSRRVLHGAPRLSPSALRRPPRNANSSSSPQTIGGAQVPSARGDARR